VRRAVLLLCLAWGLSALALEIPPPPSRFVYDGAGVMSPEEKTALEDRLMQLDQQYQLQIAVAVFPSLEGEPLEDATLRVAEAWKPGMKGQDNGLVLAAFMAERKVRIEVGYGLEEKVPDIQAGRIIREYIAPHFRAGEEGQGLRAAVDALAALALGQSPPPVPARSRSPQQAVRGGYGCFFMALWFFALMVINVLRRPRGLGRRGLRGGVPWWAWMLMGSQLGGGHRHHRSGGGFGGGGFGGGGGGSFGGGSFGGGGASGGW